MFLYYTLAAILLLITGPFLLLSAKRRAGLGQKLGLIPPDLAARLSRQTKPVWFHAVSVGEFNAAWPLIQAFHAKHRAIPLVISTATQTGQKLAREKAGHLATVIYFPLDLPFSLQAWLKAIRPQLCVIVETELWPGFTYECQKRNIPVMVVNGRISLRSFERYLHLKPLFAPILQRLAFIAAQNPGEVERYQAIGGKQLPLAALGNLKFDGLQIPAPTQLEALRRSLNIQANDLVIVAGSTHEGEESALLACLSQLQANNCKLILAPRHPERWEQVAAFIESCGYRVRRHSRQESFTGPQDVYLLDTIGQLFTYYGLGHIAFVGGTLAKIGGHNLVEPMAYGCPVVCGPHLFKTADVAQNLLAQQALIVIQNQAELQAQLTALLKSPPLRLAIGQAGQNWLAASQGAVQKTLQAMEKLLPLTGNQTKAEVSVK